MGFSIFQGQDRQYYWHLKAQNGQILAHSEGYTSRQAAEHGINAAVDVVLKLTGKK